MTLQQMKYFVAVADSGSISEAAKRLFAAQSSVSEAVRAVEGHYGIKAFLRTPKGVMLTGDGKELFIEFKGILNRLYHLDLKYEDKRKATMPSMWRLSTISAAWIPSCLLYSHWMFLNIT